MNAVIRCLLCAVLGCGLDPLARGEVREADSGRDARETVVLYNERAEGAGDLARFYAAQRRIPLENLVGVDCAVEEETSREAYDREIASPLRAVFLRKGWWEPVDREHPERGMRGARIRFLAVLRGIPLRVGAVEGYEGDAPAGPELVRHRNEAAVDSELTVLGGWNRSVSGALVNPCFRLAGGVAPPGFLWVGRLDGPSDAVVRRMIRDALEAERGGLEGFVCVDSRGIREGPYLEGDRWLEAVARQARLDGFPVVWDRVETLFPDGLPLRRLGVYMGWYAEQMGGALADAGWERGAVAVHIHSFSAVTLRDPARSWCGPLLARGVAATLGNVAEPYLALTADLEEFWRQLSNGATLAESGWMAQPVVSWMSTVLGDPLYRPFAAGGRADPGGGHGGEEGKVCREAGNLWGRQPDEARERFRREAERLRSGFLWESLGFLENQSGNPEAAWEAWGRARSAYGDPADRLRVLGWEWAGRGDSVWGGRVEAAGLGRAWARGERERAWWEGLAGNRP